MNMRKRKNTGTRSLFTVKVIGMVTHCGWVMFYDKTQVSVLSRYEPTLRATRKFGTKVKVTK